MKVYLAGPVELCSDDEVHVWRNYVCDRIKDDIEIIEPQYHLGTNAEIFHNTKTNVEMCDVIFAYLPKGITERRASYGTVFEIAYGFALDKRVIIVSDDEYVHFHPVLKGAAHQHFHCLDEALVSL